VHVDVDVSIYTSRNSIETHAYIYAHALRMSYPYSPYICNHKMVVIKIIK